MAGKEPCLNSAWLQNVECAHVSMIGGWLRNNVEMMVNLWPDGVLWSVPLLQRAQPNMTTIPLRSQHRDTTTLLQVALYSTAPVCGVA